MATAKPRIVFIGLNREFVGGPLMVLFERFGLAGLVESDASRIAPDAEPDPNRTIETFAYDRQIPYMLLTDKRQGFKSFLAKIKPDVICVVGMAQLLKREEFELARFGAINLHPSALPKYRGPDPFFWMYHEMDLNGAVTVHQIDEGVDTGDILAQQPMPIKLGEPIENVLGRASQIGGAIIARTVEELVAGTVERRPQKHLPCTLYARFIKPHERFIDWHTWPIERVWHFLRGTFDQHRASVTLPILDGRWGIGMLEKSGVTSLAPGSVASDDAGWFVAHRDGKIRLTLEIPERGGVSGLLRRVRRAFSRR